MRMEPQAKAFARLLILGAVWGPSCSAHTATSLRQSPPQAQAPGGSSAALPYLRAAQKALEVGDPDGARSQLALALRVDPKSAPAYLMLGDLELSSSRLQQAIECYEHAVLLQPDSFAGHYNLALAFLREARSEEGLRELRRAVAINPHHPDAVYNLGLVLLDDGKLQEALDYLGQASQLGSDRQDLTYNLVRAQLKAGRPQEAIEEANRAAGTFGQDADWRAAMGSLFLENGLPAEAIRQLETALRLKPGSAEVRRGLAAAYLQSGQLQAVLSLITEPSAPEDHYLRASAAFLLGQLPEADEESQRSIDGRQRDPRYLLLRARIEQHLSRQEAALKVLDQAEKLAPRWPEVFYSKACQLLL